MSNNKQTAVEWFIERLTKNPLPQTKDEFIDGDLVDITNKAKEMENHQKNNLPIHIHEGIKNTHVYIENGVVHVKPNQKPQTTENGKSNN
jgi:hypothetical protein